MFNYFCLCSHFYVTHLGYFDINNEKKPLLLLLLLFMLFGVSRVACLRIASRILEVWPVSGKKTKRIQFCMDPVLFYGSMWKQQTQLGGKCGEKWWFPLVPFLCDQICPTKQSETTNGIPNKPHVFKKLKKFVFASEKNDPFFCHYDPLGEK